MTPDRTGACTAPGSFKSTGRLRATMHTEREVDGSRP